jgi:hypothetical protein
MNGHLQQVIVSEIAKALVLLRAPPELIAKAETSQDPYELSQIFESCGAPIGYLLAVGSLRRDSADAETFEQLVYMNRLVAEIVAGAQTREEILRKLRADGRLSFRPDIAADVI